MNTQTNDAGAVNSAVTNETVVASKRRGRPIDPNKTRKVYLVQHNNEGTITYSQRTKGAPKPGSTAFYVNVQRNVKSKNFVFNADTMQVQSEVVKARTYKPKVVETAVAETVIVPATETVPTSVSTHESAAGTVTQDENQIVVDSAQAVAA